MRTDQHTTTTEETTLLQEVEEAMRIFRDDDNAFEIVLEHEQRLIIVSPLFTCAYINELMPIIKKRKFLFYLTANASINHPNIVLVMFKPSQY